MSSQNGCVFEKLDEAVISRHFGPFAVTECRTRMRAARCRRRRLTCCVLIAYERDHGEY